MPSRSTTATTVSRLSYGALLLLMGVACLGPRLAAEDAGAGFKIGLLCSGSTTDGGWNQLAKEAVDKVGAELKAKVSVLQKVTADKAGDEMRGYAADGYNLVICHGYEFLNPATEAAGASTTTHYAVSGADVAKPGLVTLDFDLSEASYQVGVLAARLTQTGKLGFIGGSPIPSVKACYRGFLAGARSVKSDISVAETYTSWDQPEQSKSQAEALIEQGVDGIYHDVDAASRGIFEAVKERDQALPAGAKTVYVYGSVADQNANAICSADTPASAVIHLDQAFLALAKTIQANAFAPGVVHEDLKRGTCVIVLNPDFVAKGTITPALQDEIQSCATKLIDGTVSVPTGP